MIEGESGIRSVAPPWAVPVYEPSKRRLTWPNGAMAVAYSADEPDRLRGPQHSFAYVDEAAAWRYPDAWDMLMMGLRLGQRPQVVVTTTPKPVPLMRTIEATPGCIVTRGRTMDNAINLAPTFLTALMARYEGTRLGRQELEGEDLVDNPDALWSRAGLDDRRVRDVQELARVVVAIDPAVTSRDDSDETGIIVAGVGHDRRGYVLADLSGRYKPDEWARIAIGAYHEYKADRIVAEANQGGEMVQHVLRTVDADVPLRLVHASRGKVARAEPVAALYEQGKVSHVGAHAKLEDQLCTWQPGMASPDRMDALVWAVTELMLGRGEVAFG
jgi:predicted phage terminase large subunit-like protein